LAEEDASGYRNLEIYQLAHVLGVRIHKVTLTLPAIERYEESPQVRRSSKRISASIVEGFALRKYKDEFLHYLHRALASAEETREHLAYLHDTGSLGDTSAWSDLDAACQRLCAGIVAFIVGVERDHTKPFYLRAGSRSIGTSGRPDNPQSAIGNPD